MSNSKRNKELVLSRNRNRFLPLKLGVSFATINDNERVAFCPPGVLFLSGGMSEVDAVHLLNEINNLAGRRPWKFTFAYGRALQTSALYIWCGQSGNVTPAQVEFAKVVKVSAWLIRFLLNEKWSPFCVEKTQQCFCSTWLLYWVTDAMWW